MKKIPIRMRLTLYIVLLLTGVCVLMTVLAMYNANIAFVIPYSTAAPGGYSVEMAPDTAESSTAKGSIEVQSEPDEYESSQAVSVTIAQASTEFNASSLWIMAAVILGGGILTYFLLGRALRPLRTLSREIGEMTENELSQRIDGFPARDEIGRLADSFNTMLTRLDKAFSDQKRFSSDAAHELKTPLAAIKTNLDVLRLEPSPTPQEYEKTLHVVEKQAGRMIKLVDNLFTMTAQRNYDFNDTVDFDAMFSDIITELTPRIRNKELAVTVHPCGFRTTANSVMLTRAFSNLVENAVKYNVRGGKIDISAKTDKKHYVFTISDTGTGIPEEKLEHIFKPFYRADESRSSAGGAGLGLAISSEIIGRHGGDVSAQSKNGKTVFTVTLPIIPPLRND